MDVVPWWFFGIQINIILGFSQPSSFRPDFGYPPPYLPPFKTSMRWVMRVQASSSNWKVQIDFYDNEVDDDDEGGDDDEDGDEVEGVGELI